jgi:hypothetical protein
VLKDYIGVYYINLIEGGAFKIIIEIMLPRRYLGRPCGRLPKRS